jgi:hypothetical protein
MPSRSGEAASRTDVEAPCAGVLRLSAGVLIPPVYFCGPVGPERCVGNEIEIEVVKHHR